MPTIPEQYWAALGRVCHNAAILEQHLDIAIAALEKHESQAHARDAAPRTFDARIERLKTLHQSLHDGEERNDRGRLLNGLQEVRVQRNDCIHGVVGHIDGTDVLNRIRLERSGHHVECRDQVVTAGEYETFAYELRVRCLEWNRMIRKHGWTLALKDGEAGFFF